MTRRACFISYLEVGRRMSAVLGELAALATSVLWSTSSTLFTLGSRRQTPQIVNRVRLVGAVILLGLSHLIFLGYLIPRETTFIWLLLGLSGIIGLALGDAFLFWSYIKMGPRVSMLLMSLAPIVTTSAAWVLFDERLSFLKVAAIIVTLSGVAWVVLDKGQNHAHFKITGFADVELACFTLIADRSELPGTVTVGYRALENLLQ
jgi:drug/metabolite transporter (DMT)-like permease